jgi:WD40 repeat protein
MRLLPRHVLVLAVLLLAAGLEAAESGPGEPGEPLPAGAVARLGTLRYRVGVQRQDAVLSPDGKRVAVAGGGEVLVLDTATGRPAVTLPRIPGTATALAFSPDGKTLASTGFSGPVRLWDMPRGRSLGLLPIRRQPGALARVSSLTFSPDGKFLAAGTRGFRQQTGVVYLWDLATRRQLGPLPVMQNGLVEVAFSADSKRLATWGLHLGRAGPGGQPDAEPGRTIQLWDVARGKESGRFKLRAGAAGVVAVAFALGGRAVAVRAGSSTVHILDAATGLERHRFEAPRCFRPLLAFSPDGRLLATSADTGAVVLWDTVTWKQQRTGKAPGAQPIGLAFLPERQVLACGLDGQALCLWDVTTGQLQTPPGGHHYTVSAVAFRPGGKGLVSADADGTVYRWDLATGQATGHFRALPEGGLLRRSTLTRLSTALPRGSVVLSADGRYAAAEGTYAQGGARVWDTATGKVVRDLQGPRTYGESRLAFSADGRLLAECGGRDGTLPVWDLTTGRELRGLSTGPALLRFGRGNMAFSPDGRFLAAAVPQLDRNTGVIVSALQLWDVATGKQRWSLPTDQGQFPVLAFSPDGKVLAAGSPQGIVLRETARGEEQRHLNAEAVLTGLAFAPDGRTLAGAAPNHVGGTYSVVVWELATGDFRHRYAGHRGVVASLAFSADSCVLATGSADTTVLLWDQTGRFLAAGQLPGKAEGLWADLGSAEAGRAFQAVGALVAAPDLAVRLLTERLRPPEAGTASADRLRRLIAELDAPRYATREKATRELERLRAAAAPALRDRLKGGASPEGRRRIEKLLARLVGATPPAEELRVLRGVEVLERVGTTHARKLLQRLAGGPEGATLTTEARAALARLRRP